MKSIPAFFLFVLFPVLLVAQETSIESENYQPIIPGPASELSAHSGTEIRPPLIQSGAFINPAEGGVEFTYRPAYGAYYGNLFFSGMIRPSSRIPNANNMFTVGVSLGREMLLHDTKPMLPGERGTVVRANAEGTQFYARFGPGIGIGGVGKINRGTEFHPMVHANVAAGFLTPMGKTRGFYVELGGKAAWFPTLDEGGFIGGPQLTIGFQLFKTNPIPLVQY